MKVEEKENDGNEKYRERVLNRLLTLVKKVGSEKWYSKVLIFFSSCASICEKREHAVRGCYSFYEERTKKHVIDAKRALECY